MPQSLSAVYIHLVFSTKERRPFLRDVALREALHQYIGGVSNTLKCQSLLVGGVEDHVHILSRLGRSIAQSDWVKEIKRVSNAWIKQQRRDLDDFAWQNGYAAFSVSHSNLESVRDYIRNQPEHHKRVSFQDEIRKFFERHDIPFDERYVWD